MLELIVCAVEIDGWTDDGEKKDSKPRDVDGAGNLVRSGKKAIRASKRIAERIHTRTKIRRGESRACDVRYKSVPWHDDLASERRYEHGLKSAARMQLDPMSIIMVKYLRGDTC